MEHGWDNVREEWFPPLAFRTLRAVEDRLAAQALENGPALIAFITVTSFRLALGRAATPARNHLKVRILKLTPRRLHFVRGELEPRPLCELVLVGPGLAAAQPRPELLVL